MTITVHARTVEELTEFLSREGFEALGIRAALYLYNEATKTDRDTDPAYWGIDEMAKVEGFAATLEALKYWTVIPDDWAEIPFYLNDYGNPAPFDEEYFATHADKIAAFLWSRSDCFRFLINIIDPEYKAA